MKKELLIKNKRMLIVLIGVLLILLVIVIILIVNSQQPTQLVDNTTSLRIKIAVDNGDEEIDWTKLPTTNINLSQPLTITEPGTYILRGTLHNSSIKVNSIGDVKLVLRGITIDNPTGPAIYIENASDTVIELPEGKTSTLIDGANYQNLPTDVAGVIYSEDDLTIEGSGTLEIIANKEDAIVSKNDLKITSGTYNITSADEAIRGKDSVYIKNGTFNINSKGDSIKSSKGFVYIENGIFNLTSSADGIQSEQDLLIQNGTFNITSKENPLFLEDATSSSTKGIKAEGNLLINNAVMNIKTIDDGLKSNKSIGIKAGTYNINTLADAIDASDKIIIDNGNITISKSNKALKSKNVIINDGFLELSALDEEISKNTKVYINRGTTNLSSLKTKQTAIDYQKAFHISKGTLIIGANEDLTKTITASNPSTKIILISFDREYTKDDIITLTNTNKKVLKKYKSSKNYSTLLIATNELKEKKTYQIKINDKLYKEFKIASKYTKITN